MSNSIPIPVHISLAKVCKPCCYKWPKTGGVDMFLEQKNPKTGGAIWFTLERTRFAIHIAITEWIVWRFEGLSRNFVLGRHLVEAMWAADIDKKYYKMNDDTKKLLVKTGDCDEPLYAAIRRLAGHYRWLFSSNRSQKVTTSLLLAAHVLPDKKPFGAWLKTILDRMQEHHHYDTSIELTDEEIEMPDGDERVRENGLPIPRIAFDPEHDYNPDNSPALLHEYLQGLDHTQNPFLVSPERMLEQGFIGTPYTYPANPPKG